MSAEIKIDKLIEEASKSFFNLGTNERRLLAARVSQLTPEERDKLGHILHRFYIGIKNGIIDGSAAALVIAALGALFAAPAGITAITAAMAAALSGKLSFDSSREMASNANDLNRTMGKKEIDKLVKELESFLGKPLVKLIKLDGQIRL